MEYFITGATGLIGTHLSRQLIDNGHDVIALTRDVDNAAHLPDAVRVVEGDVTEPATLRAPMRGVDGVFHLAAWFKLGSIHDNGQPYRINVEGTRTVLETMAELDVPRGVYTSTVGVFPGTHETPVDETMQPKQPTFSRYHRSKWAAHFEVARPMMDDGLPLVVVMPSGVYGPGDKLTGSLRGIFRRYLTGDLAVIPGGLALSFDHASDIAAAHRAAMEHGTTGESYITASEARRVIDVFDIAESLTGLPGPRPIPDGLMRAAARAMRSYERVFSPVDGYESELLAFAAGRRYLVDNTKATRELGVEFRPLAEGLAEYFTWEIEQLGRGDELSVTHADAG